MKWPVVLLLLAAVVGCRPVDAPDDPVDVIYAASLAATMERRISPRFRETTGREVRGEPRGSVAGANLIRDGLWRPDVYITADPATLSVLGEGQDPGWAIGFARGQLVIGYGPRSRFAAALDSAAAGELAWHDVVLRAEFRLGRTDPDLDPKGYRALFALQMAERLYDRPGLAGRVLDRSSSSAQVFPEEHLSARVSTGAVDAGFFYLAEAKGHGLRHVALPPPLDQSDPATAAMLAQLEYRTADGAVFRGTPILYAVTIPKGSSDAAAATEFIEFLIASENGRLLAEDGFRQATVVLGDAALVPESLRALIED